MEEGEIRPDGFVTLYTGQMQQLTKGFQKPERVRQFFDLYSEYQASHGREKVSGGGRGKGKGLCLTSSAALCPSLSGIETVIGGRVDREANRFAER